MLCPSDDEIKRMAAAIRAARLLQASGSVPGAVPPANSKTGPGSPASDSRNPSCGSVPTATTPSWSYPIPSVSKSGGSILDRTMTAILSGERVPDWLAELVRRKMRREAQQSAPGASVKRRGKAPPR
jgi:hypothetical protein